MAENRCFTLVGVNKSVKSNVRQSSKGRSYAKEPGVKACPYCKNANAASTMNFAVVCIIIIISHTNIGKKNYETKRDEEGTLELIQWPSGLYPFANRGLTGSWTDQLNQLINQ